MSACVKTSEERTYSKEGNGKGRWCCCFAPVKEQKDEKRTDIEAKSPQDRQRFYGNITTSGVHKSCVNFP